MSNNSAGAPVELDEDEYLAEMSKIIQRDFYPQLHQLKDAVLGDTPSLAPSIHLDDFQNSYTSEDNASFKRVLAAENERNRSRYARLYAGEKGAADHKRRCLEGGNGLDPKYIGEWEFRARNALMYGPEQCPLTKREIERANSNRKYIAHDATQLSDAQLEMLTQARRPRVPQKTHDFVEQTPTLRPGIDVDPSELMTWGQVQGTPIALGGEQGPSFTIADTPMREQLSNKLAIQAARNMSARQSSTYSSPRIAGVSAKRSGSRASTPLLRLASASGVDMQLRASYSPRNINPDATPSRWSIRTSATHTPSTSRKTSTPLKQTPK